MLPLSSVVYPQHWPVMLLKAKVRSCFSFAQKLKYPSHFPTEKHKSLTWLMKPKIMQPLASSLTLSFFLSWTPLLPHWPCYSSNMPAMFLPQSLCSYNASAWMPLLPLILISTYMISPHQENLLHIDLQNSKPLHNSWSIMCVCPALFLSVGLICYLFPSCRGVPEPIHRVDAVVYTLCSVWFNPSRLRIFTQRKLGTQQISELFLFFLIFFLKASLPAHPHSKIECYMRAELCVFFIHWYYPCAQNSAWQKQALSDPLSDQ